jgi:tetratricopeptide (TPR) repeat protein
MVRTPVVALIVLLLCSLSQSQQTFSQNITQSAPELSSMSVHVNTARGEPASNARVEIRDLATGQLVASGYTNSAGVLELAGVKPTEYVLEITSGLSQVTEKADIRMDRNMTVRLPATDDNPDNVGSNTSVSVAQFKVPSKARNEFKKAEEALKKNKKDECAQRVAKALGIFPNFAEALTLRAILSMDNDKPETALTDLDAAIKADPSYAFAYFALGATYNGLSRFDDAVRSLERGLSISPNSWQGYFELGKARVGKGEYQLALKQLDRAQSLVSQTYPSIHLVKAHALLALKQYPDAMNELQLFLNEAPGDSRSAEARQALEQAKAYAGK